MSAHNDAGNGDRLDGWKEIAGHFGKSIRTVQRWETRLGLPVHRLEGSRRGTPFASRVEIARWETAQPVGTLSDTVGASISATLASAEKEGPSSARPRGRVPTRASLWAFAAVVGIASLLFRWSPLARGAATAKPQPASWRVEGDRLLVFDGKDEKAWEHRFGFSFALQEDPQWRALSSPSGVIDDLEGDGRNEVLFVTRGHVPENSRLHCFEADGRPRFIEQPHRTVRFGTEDYGPPFAVTRLLVTAGSTGPKEIWISAHHSQWFPTVVEKLDSQGAVQSQFWNNGHVTLLRTARVGGRRLILIGATSNEFQGATLVVLDAAHSNGAAPARDDRYRCRDCPGGRPLAFIVFPRMELSRLFETRPFVSDVRVTPDDRLVVAVTHVAENLPGETGVTLVASVHYILDSRLQPIGGETGDLYPQSHQRLEMCGRLDHRFGERDRAEMFPVLVGQGDDLIAVTPRSPGE